MAVLNSFNDLTSKRSLFSNLNHFQIDTKSDFDTWFDLYTSLSKEEEKTNFLYRGMEDATFKLYTSAQRLWIQNDMKEWVSEGYLGFIDKLIQGAKTHPLLNKVFDVNHYGETSRELPILSIIQHYSGPTPLMDWTYNINVALFFATEKLTTGKGNNGIIDNYFSIYRIDKSKYVSQFMSIRDYMRSIELTTTPVKKMIYDFTEDANYSQINTIFYISDFDNGNTYDAIANSEIKLINNKALTSVYNQNIIPQEGLFIFNPLSEKPIDEVFSEMYKGQVMEFAPFSCFNIKKDLADYIRRRIKERNDIDKSFIYPNLYNDIDHIKNSILNSYSK